MEIEKQRNQIGGAKRWLSLAGGGAAVYFGVRRKSVLGTGLAIAGGSFLIRGLTGRQNLLEVLGLRPPDGSLPYGHGVKVRRSVTIDKPVEELYRFWHNFENLPRFMKHLEAVRTIDERRSHWELTPVAGRSLEWDAEITMDRENEIIGWRSTAGTIDNAGSVRFESAPGGRGTVVRVQLQYNPPGGRIAATLAKLFGREPDQLLADELTRFKQLMETGEIPVTEGQPSGHAVTARRRLPVAEPRPRSELLRRPEPVQEGSEASFPASDAPSWMAGGGRS